MEGFEFNETSHRRRYGSGEDRESLSENEAVAPDGGMYVPQQREGHNSQDRSGAVSSGTLYDHESANGDKFFNKTLLRPVLEEKHVNMIALSACIGVGLFLQSGRVIYLAGPGLACIAYLLAGSFIWAALGCLGEMTALFPMTGGIFLFVCRFLDEGVGYATGWLTWFAWVVIIATEVLAVTQLWNFQFDPEYLKTVGYPESTLGWPIGQRFDPAVWVSIFLILILLINFLPVWYYGQLEYIFGCIKLTFIVGIIMFNVVLSASKRIHHNPDSQFWTYDQPYGFTSQNFTLETLPDGTDKVVGGTLGVFLGMWSAMTTVVFSFIGFEAVSITAGENKDLRKTETIKIATRKISLRIILLYTLGCFVVGLNVPYTDPNLKVFTANSIRSGEHSVWILSAVRNHVDPFWPNFFNGIFIFSATTSGINALYISSRVLYSLASCRDMWPMFWPFSKLRAKLERTVWGVPYYAVVTSWCFGLLAYLSAASGSSIILGRLATNSVVSLLIVYSVVCLAYLQFHARIKQAADGKLQNLVLAEDQYIYRRSETATYPYATHFQRPRVVYGFVGCSLLAIFNGWRSFVSPFNVADFIASYISFVLFAAMIILYHLSVQACWSPWKWERKATKKLAEPTPIVVGNTKRRGHIDFTGRIDFQSKSKAVFWWIMEWMK